jgi:hypothetical protein
VYYSISSIQGNHIHWAEELLNHFLLPELPSLDKELYDGLMFLKNYDGDFAELGLTMTVDVNDFGVNRTINLIPNGSEISITRHNRLQYIYLIANYKLNIQIRRQCAAFFSGLGDSDLCWLISKERHFSSREAILFFKTRLGFALVGFSILNISLGTFSSLIGCSFPK